MPRIMLVDDDEVFRPMLRTTLIKLGHQVWEARDGDEAMAMFEQEPADVVITDIIMPGKAGLEIIGMFKTRFPGVKVIAMSGAGRIVKTNYLKLARAEGADGVLEKPFSNEQLTAMISQLTTSPNVGG
jgi:two-component system response regulator (stage 0 sporulation protein F)